MQKDETIKRLGKLELQASQQEEVINDAAANLKAQKDKFNDIIDEMRTIIRDERTGQGRLELSQKEEDENSSDEVRTSKKRLTEKNLKLPDKKK
jgi:uncharacterized coiled-coil protein SlyX